jgi:hypothetical protein
LVQLCAVFDDRVCPRVLLWSSFCAPKTLMHIVLMRYCMSSIVDWKDDSFK